MHPTKSKHTYNVLVGEPIWRQKGDNSQLEFYLLSSAPNSKGPYRFVVVFVSVTLVKGKESLGRVHLV